MFEKHDKEDPIRAGTKLRLQCPGDAWQACKEAHLRNSKRNAWLSIKQSDRPDFESFDTLQLLKEREQLHIGLELLNSLATKLHYGVAAMNPEPECEGITIPLKPTDTSLLISVTKNLTDKFEDLSKDEATKIGSQHVRLNSTLRMRPPPEMAAGEAAKPPTDVAQDRMDTSATRRGLRNRRQTQMYSPSSAQPSATQVISCAGYVCTVSNCPVSREACCRLLQIKLAIWTLGYTDCLCCSI